MIWARFPRPGPASLRLTLAVAAAIICLSLLAMAAQYRLTERSLLARQVVLLQSDLDAFASLYQQRRIPALREAMEFRAAAAEPSEALFLLLDKQGQRLAGNIDAWPGSLPSPAPGGFEPGPLRRFNVILGSELHAYQGLARELPGGFAFLVARGTGEIDRTLAELRRLILFVGAGLVFVALALGWAVSRRVIGRIQALNDLSDRVAEGDLAARLPGPRSKDEFGALEIHVHQMLDRIQSLNRATHRLSDSIAHELRTPLNRMMQKLGALRGEDGSIAAIQAEMRQAIRIFDSLLDISAAEAQSGSRSGFLPVDLSQVAGEVFELYEAVGDEKGLVMRAALQPGVKVLGDRNLIAQLLSNLVDNAIKFTPAGGEVALTLAATDRGQVLEVADTGPGLAADKREAVFERFVRAKETDEVKGHGLGLALVQAIATRHGARIELLDAEPGLKARVIWPVLNPFDDREG